MSELMERRVASADIAAEFVMMLAMVVSLLTIYAGHAGLNLPAIVAKRHARRF
jgi:hypothetical protein